MNKKNAKNILIITIITLAVAFCSFIWQNIYLNFSNVTQATGAITQQNYSTDADTLRYVIFILIPLSVFLTSFYFLKKSKTRDLNDLIKFPSSLFSWGLNSYLPSFSLGIKFKDSISFIMFVLLTFKLYKNPL